MTSAFTMETMTFFFFFFFCSGERKKQGSIPGSGRYLGEENGNPFQCSCLEIPWTEETCGLLSMGSQRESDTT